MVLMHHPETVVQDCPRHVVQRMQRDTVEASIGSQSIPVGVMFESREWQGRP